jgi:PAS domain S-box-containing protein
MPEDVMGSKFISFIHPEDLPIFQDFLTQSADALSLSTPIVMRHRHISGNWIYLESVCCNLLQDVNVQGLVINSRDITERKRTETALQDSELRLAAIASSMPATLYRLSINSDGKIAIPFISDGLIDLVGISPRYVISSPYQLLDLVHPEDVDQFKALIRDGFDKLATFHHEFRVITVSGEVKWVQNITRYYRTESDMIFADGVCIDISERGEAESSLQRTNELLRAVIKAVPVAIDIVSPEGKVLLWNAAAEKLFAWNTSTVVGHPVPSVPESQALELQAVILDTLAGRQINGVPMTFQLGDGSWTNVNVSTVLVHDPHGKIVGILRIIDEAGDRSSIETKHNQTLQLEEVQSASMVRSSTEAIANFVTLNANTLLNQYKIGQRNFAGLNLRGVYLVEADLRYADFSGVALNGSNCSYANFQSVNLRGADLRGANFQFANLQQVDLRGADLRGADLRDANTTGSILDDSNLQGALLSVD